MWSRIELEKTWLVIKNKRQKNFKKNIPQFLYKKHEIWIMNPIPTMHVRWNIDNPPGHVFNLIADIKSTTLSIS